MRRAALRVSALLLFASLGNVGAEPNILRLSPRHDPSTPAPLPQRTAADRRNAAQPVPKTDVTTVPVSRARPGPWGDLEFFTVYLEASIATLKSMDLPTYESSWKFVGYTDDQVTKLLESAKLPPALSAGLLDRTKWRHADKVITILPSPETLLGLSPESRAIIYTVLGRWEDNRFHHEPDVIAGRDVRVWLQRANLSEEILTAIEKTVYVRGKNLVFSDLPLVLRMVDSEEDRLKIRKALSRTPTLVAKLRLSPESDISKLAEYWGGYARSKDVQPFLESIAHLASSNLIDIIHLLPSSVRGLLYTFPNSSHGRSGYYPDCHWTSLNFASFEPLDRLADPTLATAYTLENYARIPGNAYRYGDVLFFMDGNTGNAIHSCVYLADDIVYTKNGRSPLQPWILMKLDDLVAFYAMYYQPQISCYRRKPE